jgi:hypothetical protein
MNELQIRPETPLQGFRPQYEAEALSAELAKMLTLVAPVTMSTDQQTLWLASAVDALKEIRPGEVAEVSMEVRRSVARHSQIVPEIARLVAEKRSHRSRMREWDRAEIAAPPLKLHIADRDRRHFTAEDWAELNVWLESQRAAARYRSDGTRYAVEASG